MRVLFLFLGIFTLSPCFAQEAQIPVQSVMPSLPKSIEHFLLQKTGAKSVSAIRELAYRQGNKFEILGAVIELKNHPDIKGDLVEGVMHVRVIFISQKDGSVKLYQTDERIETVVYANEKEMDRLMKPFK